MDPSLLLLSGFLFLAIGFLTILTGSFSQMSNFGREKTKNYSLPIGIILIVIGSVLIIPGAIMQEEKLSREMNELCESIDMEFLKKSIGGLFGNSYVLCYDEINKEIKEIPI